MSDCHDDVCITCGDVAFEVSVTSVDGDRVECVADDGSVHEIAADLVTAVRPGDRLLVHAGVALLRLEAAAPLQSGAERA